MAATSSDTTHGVMAMSIVNVNSSGNTNANGNTNTNVNGAANTKSSKPPSLCPEEGVAADAILVKQPHALSPNGYPNGNSKVNHNPVKPKQATSRVGRSDDERIEADHSLRGPSLSGSENLKGSTENKKKFVVNREFFRRLRELLRIVIPSWRSKECLILLLHTGFLVARTFVSIYVARLDGQLTKTIVDKNFWGFAMMLTRWLLIAIPATYINSMIRYLESKLSIAFRTRMVDRMYSMYVTNQTYYRVENCDSRMTNPDQCLTDDVASFCTQLAHIYSQITKPCFDITLMSAQLYMLARERTGNGMQLHYPWMVAAGVLLATILILKAATPPFGKMVAEQAKKYGHLRAVHARFITHAEEIAFYGGERIEENALRRAYYDLVSHLNRIYKKRIFYIMLEQFMLKYVWGAGGLIIIAIPALLGKKDEVSTRIADASSPSSQPAADAISIRTQDFITARGLLISAADAMERLMSSWKDVTELAGYTARVSDMIAVFKDVSEGKYKKNSSAEAQAVLACQGEVVDNAPDIKLEDVPVVTPNGDLLVQRLSFHIRPGMHLLITGPNGCGKSSLFRMIGGLWPIYGGRLTKPGQGDMFYIPQRPYLSEGTLREQFIYPDTEADMKQKNISDDDLMKMLAVVHLDYVVKREGGLDAINDWRDLLSGGEKQRVGMARVFYHKPKYAILDECTSAVSIDVEGEMYLHAKKLGITLLTVTHRPSLWKYHTHLLQFDGQGGYTFSELNENTRMSLAEERSKLQSKLADVPKMQERFKELCALLGDSSTPILDVKKSPVSE